MVAKCMKRELDGRIKVIADKITGGLNLEKRAWASLHEVEEEISKMMAEVDKDVQEAVSIQIICLRSIPGEYISQGIRILGSYHTTRSALLVIP